MLESNQAIFGFYNLYIIFAMLYRPIYYKSRKN